MANCQAGRRAGREGRKHHGSRLISSTEHREGRQHGPIETRRPRGRWCLANGRHCSPGGPGGAGKPSVSWVHSVPITLPLIPCFLSRDNIDDFFVCVCRRRAVSTGLIDFPTTGICRVYHQRVRFLKGILVLHAVQLGLPVMSCPQNKWFLADLQLAATW